MGIVGSRVEMGIQKIRKIDNLIAYADGGMDEIRESILERQMNYYRVGKTFWSVPLNPYPVPKNGNSENVVSSAYSFPGKPSWCELDLNLPHRMPFSLMVVSWDFEGRAPGKVIFGEVDPPDPLDISFSVQSIFGWKSKHWVKEMRYNLQDGSWAETSWISGKI
tara:strand:- start:11279 stop:11770 length:492 start_codon:yes stop_codon:yes gene_type:complete